jgi:hypothetical protein
MPINGTVFPQSSAFTTGEILRMDAAHSLVTEPSAAAEGRRYHNEEYARAARGLGLAVEYASTSGCRKRMPSGRMRRGRGSVPARGGWWPVGIESGSLVAEYRRRKERGRSDVPGEFRQAPPVLEGELMVSGQLKSGLTQDLRIGPPLPR